VKRRRDDRLYIRSALATLAFYAALLATLAAIGYFLRWIALAGLGALLVWLYRGAIFGAERWPEKIDVERLFEHENERRAERVDEHRNEGARGARR